MRVVLLGPQRRPTVEPVVRSLGLAGAAPAGPAGPFATVTAGWQEREPDDGELRRLLAGRDVNLGLYRRWLDVQERDPEYFGAERALGEILAEMAEEYLLRLDYALQAVYALQRRAGQRRAADDVLGNVPRSGAAEDAIAAVRELDAAHLRQVNQARLEFYGRFPPHDRPVIAGHRAEVAAVLRDASALVLRRRPRGGAGRRAAPVQRGGGAAVRDGRRIGQLEGRFRGDRVVGGGDGADRPDRALR